MLCIRVGTDLSRPAGISITEEDVINRSLQSVYSYIYFVKHDLSQSPQWLIAEEDVINRSLHTYYAFAGSLALATAAFNA